MASGRVVSRSARLLLGSPGAVGGPGRRPRAWLLPSSSGPRHPRRQRAGRRRPGTIRSATVGALVPMVWPWPSGGSPTPSLVLSYLHTNEHWPRSPRFSPRNQSRSTSRDAGPPPNWSASSCTEPNRSSIRDQAPRADAGPSDGFRVTNHVRAFLGVGAQEDSLLESGDLDQPDGRGLGNGQGDPAPRYLEVSASSKTTRTPPLST